jgi:hypothetical protein
MPGTAVTPWPKAPTSDGLYLLDEVPIGQKPGLTRFWRLIKLPPPRRAVLGNPHLLQQPLHLPAGREARRHGPLRARSSNLRSEICNLKSSAAWRLAQDFEKPLPIPLIMEDRFPSVAAIHHAINRARILNA